MFEFLVSVIIHFIAICILIIIVSYSITIVINIYQEKKIKKERHASFLIREEKRRNTPPSKNPLLYNAQKKEDERLAKEKTNHKE